MKNFAEKIRFLIGSKKEINAQESTPFDFVKSPKAILRELVISSEAKNIIGVYCKAFGEGMVLTAVDKIEKAAGGEIIVFYPFDMRGRALSKTRIGLEEIQMVCPFSRRYQDPSISKKDKISEHQSITAASA